MIYHLFNEHTFCDSKWCKPLRLEEEKLDDNIDDMSIDSEMSSDISDEISIKKKAILLQIDDRAQRDF